MRTWSRCTRTQLCGQCGERIALGDPVLVLSFAAVKATKTRCHRCAGAPVPDALPEITAPPPVRPLRLTNQAVLDWKARGAGEGRDVGEEG